MDSNEELKDIVIEDVDVKEGEYQMASSTDELEKFDFTSEKEFDIEGYHELVNTLREQTEDESMKELVKLQEAKNIIEKSAKEFLDPAFVDQYTQEERNLMNMIKKFDPNLEEVKKLTEAQKDKIYDIAQYLFNTFQKKLNELNFRFPLTNEEYKLIMNIFKNKLEYDQNEVFQLRDLKENYLDKNFKMVEGNYYTEINVNDLIIFYHLFSKHKVKGITNEYYAFVDVLTKIGERIKLFNAYNVIVQRLSNDFQIWGGALSIDGDLVGNTQTEVQPTDNVVVVDKEAGEVVK
jgi:hypothetical protein